MPGYGQDFYYPADGRDEPGAAKDPRWDSTQYRPDPAKLRNVDLHALWHLEHLS
jgi:hypothetical protein